MVCKSKALGVRESWGQRCWRGSASILGLKACSSPYSYPYEDSMQKWDSIRMFCCYFTRCLILTSYFISSGPHSSFIKWVIDLWQHGSIWSSKQHGHRQLTGEMVQTGQVVQTGRRDIPTRPPEATQMIGPYCSMQPEVWVPARGAGREKVQ